MRPPTARRVRVPRQVWTVLGPITVSRVRFEDKNLLGLFNPKVRTIAVQADLEEHVAAVTTYHEWVHAILFDTGATEGLSKEAEEIVCSAIGTAIVAAKREGLL